MTSLIVVPQRVRKALKPAQLNDFVNMGASSGKKKQKQKFPLKMPKKLRNRQGESIGEKVNKKRESLMKENIENLTKSAKKKISPEEFNDRTILRFRGQDEKRKKKIAKLKSQIMEENNKELSFKPRINKRKSNRSRSRTPLVDRVSKILFDKDKKLNSLRKEISNQKEENELKDCTFQPETLTSPKDQSRKNKRKNSKNAMKGVERLLDWKKERDVKLMNKKNEKKNASLKKSQKNNHNQLRTSCNIDMVSERLYKKYEVKKKKLEKRKKEQMEGLFHPKINKKSLEIAKDGLRISRIMKGRVTPITSKTPTRRPTKVETEFKVTPIRKNLRRNKPTKSSRRKSKTVNKRKQDNTKENSRQNKKTRRGKRNKIEEDEEEEESDDEDMIEIPTTFHSDRHHYNGGSGKKDLFSSLVFRREGVETGRVEALHFLKDLCMDVEQTVNKIR